MTDYQTLLHEKIAEIYRYLDKHNATAQESAEVIYRLLNTINVESYGEYYFNGTAYPLNTDILTGLRAERLNPYLKKKAWMTGSDVAKICLSLQKYVDQEPRTKEEYKDFLKWLKTGPVDGEFDHFRYEKFFEVQKHHGRDDSEKLLIEVDDREPYYF